MVCRPTYIPIRVIAYSLTLSNHAYRAYVYQVRVCQWPRDPRSLRPLINQRLTDFVTDRRPFVADDGP